MQLGAPLFTRAGLHILAEVTKAASPSRSSGSAGWATRSRRPALSARRCFAFGYSTNIIGTVISDEWRSSKDIEKGTKKGPVMKEEKRETPGGQRREAFRRRNEPRGVSAQEITHIHHGVRTIGPAEAEGSDVQRPSVNAAGARYRESGRTGPRGLLATLALQMIPAGVESIPESAHGQREWPRSTRAPRAAEESPTTLAKLVQDETIPARPADPQGRRNVSLWGK